MILRFIREENGATVVEYAILAALIAAVLIAVVLSVGGEVNTMYDNTLTDFQSAKGN